MPGKLPGGGEYMRGLQIIPAGVLVALIAALFIGPVAAQLIDGGMASGTTVNNSPPNITTSVNLAAYGPVKFNGFFYQCSENDDGATPGIESSTFWTDANDGTQYNYKDFCLDSNTLVEFACGQKFAYNGTPADGFAGIFTVNCAANGYSHCDQNAEGFGKCV